MNDSIRPRKRISEQAFDLGKREFDRLELWAVWWKIQYTKPSIFEGILNFFMGAAVVKYEYCIRRVWKVANIRFEHLSVDAAVKT